MEAEGERGTATNCGRWPTAAGEDADPAAGKPDRNLYVERPAGQAGRRPGQLDFARQLLDDAAAGQDGDEDLRGFEWHYLHRLAHPVARTIAKHPAQVNFAAVTGDGRLVACACCDGSSG